MVSSLLESKGWPLIALLSPHSSIMAQLYCQPLNRLTGHICHNCPNHGSVCILHDNTRPHIAKITIQKLLELGLEVPIHPPYSPAFASSEYHLLHFFSNALWCKYFSKEHEPVQWLKNFFASKTKTFYRAAIQNLRKNGRKWLAVPLTTLIKYSICTQLNFGFCGIFLKLRKVYNQQSIFTASKGVIEHLGGEACGSSV